MIVTSLIHSWGTELFTARRRLGQKTRVRKRKTPSQQMTWHAFSLCIPKIGECFVTRFTALEYGRIGELTKIITLLEFFNFVSEVSRLQYEWSSDCWCIWKSLRVNTCLQWRNVFSFHWRSVLVFCEFYEVIIDSTCALADQFLYAGIVYEHYCLCPGWPCARKSFKNVGLWNWLYMYMKQIVYYPYPPGRPRLGP
jgi:hypothetical protein